MIQSLTPVEEISFIEMFSAPKMTMILTEDVGVHPGVSGRGAVVATGVDSIQLRPVSILINQRPADITLKKIYA